MFVYDIVFHFTGEQDDFDYALTDYLSSLSGSNQIIYETINISCTENIMTVRVSVPYADSLDEKYNRQNVNDASKRLKQYLAEPVVIKYVGEDYTFDDCCSTGKDAEYYVLCINPRLKDMSPVCCGHCRGNIPYYLLPRLSDKTVRELTSWQVPYEAYDELFYATGIGEISAHKMLSNISSRLNQKGLSVCRMLEQELVKPVYYYLYRFYGKQPSKCPVCGGEWKRPEGGLFDYKCDKCKIVADATPNE